MTKNGFTALIVCLALLCPTFAEATDSEEPHIDENGLQVQQYADPFDQSQRTLIWTKGVSAPKMSNDLENYGKPGYFTQSKEASMPKFRQFETIYPYEGTPAAYEHTGYYDINKTNFAPAAQGPMCYLATTSGMIHWWLDQNSEYMKMYMDGLRDGTFQQGDGLVPIDPTQSNVWDSIMSPVPIVNDIPDGDNCWRQGIVTDPLTKETLFPVYTGNHDGGWMDSVAGFWFNGYSARDKMISPLPEKYKPDVKGGYFFPIFGKTPLATRMYSRDYAFYRDNISKWLNEGKAIGLSFYPTGSGTHAINLWGAEYDTAGELRRIFVTDSNDNTNGEWNRDLGATVSRSLYSFEIVNRNGEMKLSNGKGEFSMDGIVVLSSGQDVWEAVKADPNKGADVLPNPPTVTKHPMGRNYGKNATADELTVGASVSKTDQAVNAFLTYQWYRADHKGGPFTKIQGATSSSYRPVIGDTEKTEYYYCEITNNKYGKKASVDTESAEIVTTLDFAVDAVEPVFHSFSETSVSCFVGDRRTITVSAEVSDGGTLTYQWFKAHDMVGDLSDPVTEATESNVFTIPTDQDGTTQYYCQIVNTNLVANGKSRSVLNLYNLPVTVHVQKRPSESTATITFFTPGAKLSVPSLTAEEGASIQEPANPERTGYHFVGWCADPSLDSTVPFPTSMPVNGMTLYAKWECEGLRGIEYEITNLSAHGGPSGDFSNFKVNVSLKNVSAAEIDHIFLATYSKNGQMLGLYSKEIVSDPFQLPTAGGLIPSVSFDLVDTGHQIFSIKAFVLPQSESVTPLAAAFTTNLNSSQIEK